MEPKLEDNLKQGDVIVFIISESESDINYSSNPRLTTNKQYKILEVKNYEPEHISFNKTYIIKDDDYITYEFDVNSHMAEFFKSLKSIRKEKLLKILPNATEENLP